MWFFMTLYAQNVLGYSPLEAGLALVPSSLAVVVGSKSAPRFMPVLGARKVAVLGTVRRGGRLRLAVDDDRRTATI